MTKLRPEDKKTWRGMCFSITTPPKTKPIFKKLLDDHAVISTLKSNEPFTLAGFEQSSVIIPSIQYTFQALYSLIDLETSRVRARTI